MSIENLNWDLPQLPYTLNVTVQAPHIDLMRHTNSVVYLQWLEDVALGALGRPGPGPSRI